MVKVEEGLCDGRVLFHSHVSKSPAERAALQQRKETEVQLKDVRRKQQVCLLTPFHAFPRGPYFDVARSPGNSSRFLRAADILTTTLRLSHDQLMP